MCFEIILSPHTSQNRNVECLGSFSLFCKWLPFFTSSGDLKPTKPAKFIGNLCGIVCVTSRAEAEDKVPTEDNLDGTKPDNRKLKNNSFTLEARIPNFKFRELILKIVIETWNLE